MAERQPFRLDVRFPRSIFAFSCLMALGMFLSLFLFVPRAFRATERARATSEIPWQSTQAAILSGHLKADSDGCGKPVYLPIVLCFFEVNGIPRRQSITVPMFFKAQTKKSAQKKLDALLNAKQIVLFYNPKSPDALYPERSPTRTHGTVATTLWGLVLLAPLASCLLINEGYKVYQNNRDSQGHPLNE